MPVAINDDTIEISSDEEMIFIDFDQGYIEKRSAGNVLIKQIDTPEINGESVIERHSNTLVIRISGYEC